MEFTNLAEYAPNWIPTEREKVRRFIKGLNSHMAKDITSYQDDKTYLQVVNMATRKEAFDKIARDNSKEARTIGSYSGFSVRLHSDMANRVRVRSLKGKFQLVRANLGSPILYVLRAAKDIQGNAFWVRKVVSNATIRVILRDTVHNLEKLRGHLILRLGVVPIEVEIKEETEPARFYAVLDRQNAEASNRVITCILSVCGRLAYVLVDTGSTFSYVSSYFCVEFVKAPKKLGVLFEVFTPIGESIKVEYIFRNCMITV
ncbi:uncharacterized protein [Nicotiana tomentosiformis]|uniref:uncharacterized protein n=1 Tax=Nicotiana tomentosiformis TaxID=4098 RepID=UPI00388C34FF